MLIYVIEVDDFLVFSTLEYSTCTATFRYLSIKNIYLNTQTASWFNIKITENKVTVKFVFGLEIV